ncbi:sensor histidine kinase [Microbacterium allomyrinae]|jgi:signal transduction histidine kinase|uniref:histidine kinase n=1 Tax=Microbacterium allomyrinae TaxID=2830666 RepID=A0A9X1S264_9MICO|nr:histidine kinase [Microbacterium allomyrinae]MCC2031679.1 sensor histidine kinase [Microbacterium allomyrinae]
MTSDTSPSAPSTASPLRVAGAIAQLAALGVVGPAIFSLLFGLLGLGIGLLPVLGIGLLFLVAFVYAIFALGWLEAARVDGLYAFGLAPHRVRSSGRPGFGGFLRTLWLQTIDPSSWRGVANAAIATILGWVVLLLAGLAASGIVLVFAPLFAQASAVSLGRTDFAVPLAWAVPVGLLAALVGAAGVIGLGILHGIISRAIIVPSREAQLAEAARTSSVQREGAVRAADVERTRIERDLHDGVQPRLVSVGMTLGLAQQKIDSDPDAAKALVAEAHTSTKAAITELRQLARGIHTAVLDDRGLDAALSALAGRSVIPVQLDVRLDGRCSRDAEAAAYFAIAEALTNAAKHSRGTECRVVVRRREPGTLWARVEDNGVGGATVMAGGGLDGIINRVLAAGGEARIDSPAGGPTSVEVSIPCGS